jgi:hypothetical protein
MELTLDSAVKIWERLLNDVLDLINKLRSLCNLKPILNHNYKRSTSKHN